MGPGEKACNLVKLLPCLGHTQGLTKACLISSLLLSIFEETILAAVERNLAGVPILRIELPVLQVTGWI
jgi:hypothetical protein